jgi:plasmid stabilization system protein ParE
MLMSSPDRNRKIVLSACARQDFIDILRFTGETWGQGQLHVYRDKINDALQLLARNPALGQPSPDCRQRIGCILWDHMSWSTSIRNPQSRSYASCISA